ncbi:MAG: hypothetical protein KGL55_07115 [Rhodospirillales bacterium]|nr:hypothetical protein [Rhodospirillales bacterium]
MAEPPIVVAPTVTKLPDCRGAVLVTGSHGGAYPGRLAALAGVRAAIFHDAGIGRDEAGIASLAMLEGLGIAAAAISHLTARVGDTGDMLARGRVSCANAPARAAGVQQGMSCAAAAERLRAAPWHTGTPPAGAEGRAVLHPPGAWRALVLIDSAAMVDAAADRGAVIVTGSHGGLVGGDPAMALRADGFAAAYNDAGIGIEQAGIARLAALEARGIAALTVACASAQIGSARATLEDGVISAANPTATRLGAVPGLPARDILLAWTRLVADG